MLHGLGKQTVVVWAMLALTCAALVGCGQSEYDQNLGKSLKLVEHASKFADLELNYTTVADTPFQLRLPKAFDASIDRLTPVSPDPENQTLPAVHPERMQPGLVTVPGMKLMCQGTVKDQRGVVVPYFCHIAALPAATDGENPIPKLADTLPAELEGALRPAGEAAPAAGTPTKLAWKTAELETPTMGQTMPWKTLEVKTTLGYRALRTESNFDLPGVLRLYLYEGDGQQLLIVWRVPETVEEVLKTEPVAQRLCGSVRAGG